jgi:hypothetical protein
VIAQRLQPLLLESVEKPYLELRTGVTPMPALSSTTGPSPGGKVKLPLGALTSRTSPLLTCVWRKLLPLPFTSCLTLSR